MKLDPLVESDGEFDGDDDNVAGLKKQTERMNAMSKPKCHQQTIQMKRNK